MARVGAILALAFDTADRHRCGIPAAACPRRARHSGHPHRGVGYFWWEEQTSQLSYADSWGVLYLYRKAGTTSPEAQGWQTAEEAFAHFRLWLTANDWIYAGIGIDNPAVPESRFLKPEQGRRFYRRTDHNIQATVMVWPIGAPLSAFHNSFHVVVTTERPSWARILQKDLD
jgi:hypothetical protein